MIINTMISNEQYNDMKEYWDYQRKIEYNREKCQAACENIKIIEDDNEVDMKDFFEVMWNRIETNDYEDPPKGWVPRNKDYRLEGEIYREQDHF